mmetsp:Transcript_7787/g.19091  ORF Transcript_7787/g.19091 Transcript_7787/m.19091 type:complete len:95 (+) Transcript_7787:101-385(+)
MRAVSLIRKGPPIENRRSQLGNKDRTPSRMENFQRKAIARMGILRIVGSFRKRSAAIRIHPEYNISETKTSRCSRYVFVKLGSGRNSLGIVSGI